jgi:hypothetical protein
MFAAGDCPQRNVHNLLLVVGWLKRSSQKTQVSHNFRGLSPRLPEALPEPPACLFSFSGIIRREKNGHKTSQNSLQGRLDPVTTTSQTHLLDHNRLAACQALGEPITAKTCGRSQERERERAKSESENASTNQQSRIHYYTAARVAGVLMVRCPPATLNK